MIGVSIPWVVAEHVFRPAYIAGWSACEHWEFTEQIFRDVAVFTTSPIRQRQVTIDQTNFCSKKDLGTFVFLVPGLFGAKTPASMFLIPLAHWSISWIIPNGVAGCVM